MIRLDTERVFVGELYNDSSMVTDPLFYRIFKTSPETLFLVSFAEEARAAAVRS